MTFDFPENDLKMSEYVTARAHIAKAMGATNTNPVPRRGPYDALPLPVHSQHWRHHHGGGPGDQRGLAALQCWNASNLFISGASVFPQNSGYNPTGPVGALGYGSARTS
jgi:gluconate 2-dehydrogenase alpha chain